MHNNRRTVLHVDDDPLLTQMVAKRLEKHGFEVVSVNNALDVMDEIVRHQYRLVLLDVDMPHKSGLQLLDEIKNLDSGIQVIMLTGLVNVTTVMETHRLGAEACLFKPIDDIEPLVRIIDESFRKIDRWWNSLNDLMQRRQEEELGCQEPVTV